MFVAVNQVFTLGKDIELSYLPDGTAIAKMSLASSDRVKKKGEWEDETCWWNGTYFGNHAEKVAGSATKGDFIEVRGVVRSNDWTDKEGKKHSDKYISIEKVKTLTKKPQSTQQTKPQPKPKVEPEFEIDSDEIPF